MYIIYAVAGLIAWVGIGIIVVGMFFRLTSIAPNKPTLAVLLWPVLLICMLWTALRIVGRGIGIGIKWAVWLVAGKHTKKVGNTT